MNYTVKQMQLTKPAKKRLATGDGFGILLVIRGNAHISGRWNTGADNHLQAGAGTGIGIFRREVSSIRPLGADLHRTNESVFHTQDGFDEQF